jgi:hypothetical protein
MRNSLRRILFVCLAWLLLLPVGAGVQAQAPSQASDTLFFESTSHRVSGEFLSAYRAAKNPQVVYGDPITDAFIDQTTGHLVQYFERTRFEIIPDAPPELRVQVNPLGYYLYMPGLKADEPAYLAGACRTFPETGMRVCEDFLKFFDANGGVAQFGYPISGIEIHDGNKAQYFQKARFEWKTLKGRRTKEVILGNLGSEYFAIRSENPTLLLPNRDNFTLQTILRLRIRAYTASVITPIQGGRQTIYVIVRDQNYLAVQGAEISLKITLPSGQVRQFEIPTSTNSLGVASYTFPVAADSLGRARIDVTARFKTLQGNTTTSFQIWN